MKPHQHFAPTRQVHQRALNQHSSHQSLTGRQVINRRAHQPAALSEASPQMDLCARVPRDGTWPVIPNPSTSWLDVRTVVRTGYVEVIGDASSVCSFGVPDPPGA